MTTKQDILNWFYRHYEDPVHNCPYESAEGGYQYIWGGPYDAREEIEAQFPKASAKVVDAVVAELEDDTEDTPGCTEWSGVPKE